MKTQINLLAMLMLLFLAACNNTPLGKRATGLAYEVVVTMDAGAWEGEAGQAVKNDLLAPVPGLPQAEPSMRITFARPSDFNGLLTYVKNIVIVDINSARYTKVSISGERNRWADGQLVLTLHTPDANTLVQYLNEHPRVMVDLFTREEMSRGMKLLETDYSRDVFRQLSEQLNVTLRVPGTMSFSKSGQDFFWCSNNAGTGRTDVVVYAFPYRDADTFTRDYLVAKRDSVMKANMPGAFPDSYMATETRYVLPEYKAITLNDRYCGVLRGLWRMQGDMMGGPFVSHARLDEENNRVVVAEVFVYAPETDKRNYIRRGECSLYTLQVPGDGTRLPEISVVPGGEE
ncbi:DUF4837 family protein [Parabacteroides sp. PF5-6]|uniref:DUF4837 family protein n=1 Tax=Parabacteroides sp. PF5-6 TaxID=1742403 RepID=UPI002404C507|nr:DUF4837 family protein [Parabacteroides sp. PF5-6]MDF9831781.1 hypothetical protein [Parabacteroides sp. PF5-6]